VPFRPSNGVYVVVGPQADGEAMVQQRGVAGTWQFTDASSDRHIAVAFVDGDLWQAASALSEMAVASGELPEWAGPLERVDAFRWDWFATLTPQ
jgi:hypothetical protein